MTGAAPPPDPAPSDPDAPCLHASAVALQGGRGPARAVLILGPSGSGKSALALSLVTLGARLVADDRTCLRDTPQAPLASAPASVRGLIEARGIGLLRLPALSRAAVAMVVDLAQTETQRMPPRRVWTWRGHRLPLFHGVASDHFPAAILTYLSYGPGDPP